MVKVWLSFIAFLLGTVGLAGDFKLTPFKKQTLKNGVTVYLMEQKELPLVHISIGFQVGAIHDGKSLGLAYLTGKSLGLGAKDLPKDELEEKMDFLGAIWGIGTDGEGTYVEASCLRKDLGEVMRLLGKISTEPSFPKKEFKELRGRHLAKLAKAKESPRSVIGNFYRKFLFGNHPYGNPKEGIQETVEKVTVKDIREFFRTMYQPQNMVIVAVGDIDSSKLLAQIEKDFGGIKPGKTPVKAVPPPKYQNAGGVLLIDKADSIQSTFLIGGPGIDRGHPLHLESGIVNTVLGGRFTSWLNQALRVESGLSYGARSRMSSYRNGGIFYISSFTKTKNTLQALDLAYKTYGKLWKEGIGEDDLASAKSYVKGQFPPKFETNGALADLLSDFYFYSIDQEYIDQFSAKVDQMDSSTVTKVINEVFPKDGLSLVVVGPAKDIREGLKKYGKVTEVKISDDKFFR